MNPSAPLQQTYSGGALGSTVPGQQQLQQTQNLQAQVAAGTPLNSQQLQATTNAYGAANTAMGQIQTPQSRQQYLDNTQIGPMQNNYSDLANQLAQYDKVVLQPQFAGQNPGMPTDLPNNPYVTFGNVSYLTPQSSQLPAAQGMYNANPGYALTSQANQGNNIADLLNTINSAISGQAKIGTNKYSSDLSSASSLLGGLKDILGLNTQLAMKQAELAQSASSKGLTANQQKQILGAELQSVQGKDFHVSPTDYARIKNEAFNLGVDTKTFDGWFQGFRNPDQSDLFPTDTYEVDPAALTAQERTSIQKEKDQKSAQQNLNGFADQLLGNWQQESPVEKALSTVPVANKVGLLAPNVVKNDSIFYDQLIKNLKASIGGRITNQEISLFHDQLPNAGDSAETAQYKIDTLKGLVAQKISNPNTTINSSGTVKVTFPDGSSTLVSPDKMTAALNMGGRVSQ